MLNNGELYSLSTRLGIELKRENKFITCAESCTGGWVAKTITDVSGSGNWFERGFVTYSNRAKIELLGVRPHILAHEGVVSNSVVVEMAYGALRSTAADYAVAVSGIAGPDGGTIEIPVGTVCFGFAKADGKFFSQIRHFEGDRNAVRYQSVYFVLSAFLAIFF